MHVTYPRDAAAYRACIQVFLAEHPPAGRRRIATPGDDERTNVVRERRPAIADRIGLQGDQK